MVVILQYLPLTLASECTWLCLLGANRLRFPGGEETVSAEGLVRLQGVGWEVVNPLFFPLVSRDHYLWSMASGKDCISVLSGPHR